eukprot:GHVT01006293.1.p1 GENE.GHVT01006293.1~~GHVT01006293.1.p1  ORF type:complete len:165 (-),score=28.70 GHVT01006293.1:272-766(-)
MCDSSQEKANEELKKIWQEDFPENRNFQTNYSEIGAQAALYRQVAEDLRGAAPQRPPPTEGQPTVDPYRRDSVKHLLAGSRSTRKMPSSSSKDTFGQPPACRCVRPPTHIRSARDVAGGNHNLIAEANRRHIYKRNHSFGSSLLYLLPRTNTTDYYYYYYYYYY